MDSNLTAATSSTRVALPTAFIDDPAAAYKQAIGTYFTVGSLGVFIWDVLFNLEHDFQLVRSHGASLPSAIYFISRISTLAFAMLETILLTVPIDDCKRYQISTLFFYNLFIASTMLLSYFRVCAIWHRNTILKGVFGLLWLAGVCGSLTSAAGIVSRHEGGSPYCTENVIGQFVSAAVISPMINHLSVFVAITYGVCKHCAGAHDKLTIKAGYKVFVLGESLPTFSKAILQACQMCYLAATVAGILAVGWFFAFASNPSYRLAMFVPYAVTVNILFSWVFRRTKLGMCAAIPIFNSQQTAPKPECIEMQSESCVMDIKPAEGAPSSLNRCDTPASHLEIEVNQVVEYKHDYPSLEVGTRADMIDFGNFGI